MEKEKILLEKSKKFLQDVNRQYFENTFKIYAPQKVKDLNIVISSSWRGDMEDLKLQLEEQGFKYWNLVIDKTCKPKLNTLKEPPYDLKTDYFYLQFYKLKI